MLGISAGCRSRHGGAASHYAGFEQLSRTPVCPEVVEAGIRALEKYGTGCSGSRFLNGTLDLHLELEAELAGFLGKDEAMTFGTGFQTNLGIISALVGRYDYLICDKESHASVYCAAQMCLGKLLRFRHNDMVLNWRLTSSRSRRAAVRLLSWMVSSRLAEILPICRKSVALHMAMVQR